MRLLGSKWPADARVAGQNTKGLALREKTTPDY